MELHGRSIIAGEAAAGSGTAFDVKHRTTGEPLPPQFVEATAEDIDRAVAAAAGAFEDYRSRTADQRAAFLERIADELVNLGDELIQRANAETALPEARLLGERARTVGQLRMFADLIREGSWVEAHIDRDLPDRKPLPKPDLRRMLIPLGPVAVFGASNFPFAFSVPGGDTASALAAGCPVVVKAHPAHPGTSELCARAIAAATEAAKMPRGVFSMLQGAGVEVGVQLITHAGIKAVGFTGSHTAGRAIYNAAAARPEPIPVYAEMGSTNPVFVLPGALAERGKQIAEGLVQSVTLGVGQFCTNPGLAFGLNDEQFQQFVRSVVEQIGAAPPGTMLYDLLCDRYNLSLKVLTGVAFVDLLAQSSTPSNPPPGSAPAAVFGTDAAAYMAEKVLHDEVFGPSTLIVSCNHPNELLQIARSLPGQLTATIHGTEDDLHRHRELVSVLEQRAGRLIINGFPTGVEVCPSMQHGGPYPATTDSRSTSVGTEAIKRFARPVCYQGFPQELLPMELRNKNERGILRLVDNQFTRDDC